MSTHWVYIVECADGTYYTGYTTDVVRRVRDHNAGRGAKYTRGRTPVELVYAESHPSRSAAMSREYELKQRTRSAKETLVETTAVPRELQTALHSEDEAEDKDGDAS